MTVAVNACADAYYEQAYPQRTPTLWITVTCRVCDLLAICLTQVEGRGGGGGAGRQADTHGFHSLACSLRILYSTSQAAATGYRHPFFALGPASKRREGLEVSLELLPQV
jgi:hypothetical protein